MSFLRLLLANALLLAGSATVPPNAAQAAALGSPQLEGQWLGELPVPGGSKQLSITVRTAANGETTAELRVATTRLTGPMRVQQQADSVFFYADNVGCRFAGSYSETNQQLRGSWHQPGYHATLVLARKAPAAAAAAFRTEEVHVSSPSSPNSEIGLGGSITWPAGVGPFPAVALLADASTSAGAGSRQLLPALAAELVRQGVAVLQLDKRGTGRSEAVAAATSSTELVADAYSALAFLRARPGINPMQVGLMGHGEGANIALLAATQAPAPAFLVAMGAAGLTGQELLARQTALVNQPGTPDTAQQTRAYREALALALARREAKQQLASGATPTQAQLIIAKERLRLSTEARKRSDALYKRQYAMLEIIRQTPDNAQAQAIVANMLKQIHPRISPAAAQERAGQLTSPWHRAFLAFNPQTDLAKINCPALLLHGTADAQVPAALNLPPLERGLKANKRVRFEKLEGVNHAFEAPASEQALATNTLLEPTVSADALDTIREWLGQQLKP